MDQASGLRRKVAAKAGMQREVGMVGRGWGMGEEHWEGMDRVRGWSLPWPSPWRPLVRG